ncbi:hypothetical protein M951_chr1102 (nucleomorph) [Lotharella oceanica]|uniref:Uncharacterized protein n=1 Tax=Lotharella oceanica TaxID=641309 RepID=A0A060DGC4_9EUKA|nr:hypothetical protein M951_chr1102 [Lotharella oceanica]
MLLENYDNSFKLWKELIFLGKNKIDKLIFVLLFENLLNITGVLLIIAKFLWSVGNFIKSRKTLIKTISHSKNSLFVLINILLLEITSFKLNNSNFIVKLTKKTASHVPNINYNLFPCFISSHIPKRILYYFSIYLLQNKLKMN